MVLKFTPQNKSLYTCLCSRDMLSMYCGGFFAPPPPPPKFGSTTFFVSYIYIYCIIMLKNKAHI